ncbi:hypothetical protein QBC33DRAFT_68183 [Phialemonium atrogriseum]|uniref:Uncharacterized protein n=1 Tax=Phialemonium atrogriseum TaxID=1093897 RepID=A0AAJ0C2C0_9PEZI|nr:uncharacterized protein QBC33DRAFT_68183 [Phialemonium atrogriseum]KAK1767422.1 hypothetical protein QBC33DRAFT_68183 [Phialemonium atrogriseum]
MALRPLTAPAAAIVSASRTSSVTQWLRLFVAKDPSFEIRNLPHEEFDSLVHAGIQQYEFPVSTNDADLSKFRGAGGKMLTFHGLASNPSESVWQSISRHSSPWDDNAIPAKSTEVYYEAVMSLLPRCSQLIPVIRGPWPRPLLRRWRGPAHCHVRAAAHVGREWDRTG